MLSSSPNLHCVPLLLSSLAEITGLFLVTLFFKSLVCFLESLNKSNVSSLVSSSARPCELFRRGRGGGGVIPVSMVAVGNLERTKPFSQALQ